MILWSLFLSMTLFLLASNSPFMATLTLASVSLLVGVLLAQSCFSWMFFTVVILFVGGMMVLFMYLCSLSASLKTESNSALVLMAVLLSLLVGGWAGGHWAMPEPARGAGLFSFYESAGLGAMVFLVVYLLVGLVVAIQVASKFEGPLKNKISDEL